MAISQMTKWWLVVPANPAVNARLSAHAQRLSGDRAEEGVRCYDGVRTNVMSGWRFEDFSSEMKPVLRAFTRGEIRVFRFSAKNLDGCEWRHNILQHLPRRQRYAKAPRRRVKAKAA